MRSYREADDIRAGFAAAAARLDAALAASWGALAAAGVAVEERSDRSGEDRHSPLPVPLCSWAHLFSRRGAAAGLVVATTVALTYTEEVFAGADAAPLEGEAKGDVFGLGSQSLFVWRERRAFPLGAAGGERLGALVLAGLTAAGHRLPVPYRGAAALAGAGPADGASRWTDGRAT